ncbi:brix domain-containing protein, putative [Eimeria necatrix]|uniref:Ribosome production factor 2 homolog n=1 Tax=Eimeria necatrix TaxID=51315 RepID=U6MVP6_9EIME|nr:brix domain-containing protein, putative [Eimeria necatrix]CDJ67068.1 brix domain-containing protein, putative [Eimeria necatrix]
MGKSAKKAKGEGKKAGIGALKRGAGGKQYMKSKGQTQTGAWGDLSGLSATRKAKTHKGRRILAARESESFPAVKSLLLLRGSRCSADLLGLLGDLRDLKKPNAVYLSQRKQENLHPFENAEPIEYLARKNGCGLFAYASSSKKRPARLVLGRVYDNQILDMQEFAVAHYTPAAAFAAVQAPAAGSAPLLLLQGGLWDVSDEMRNARNIFGDLFRAAEVPPDGPTQKLYLGGVDRLIAVSAVQATPGSAATATTTAAAAKAVMGGSEDCETEASASGATADGTDSTAADSGYSGDVLICVRHYRIALVKAADAGGVGGPAVKLVEVGPQIDLRPDRVRLPSAEMWKSAVKSLEKAKAEERRERQKAAADGQGTVGGPHASQKVQGSQALTKKKSKNITTNVFGDSVGRVYVGNTDFTRLKQIQSPMLHKLRREENKGKKQRRQEETAE